MNSRDIDTRRLRLARIKVYEEEAQGSRFLPSDVEQPYVFLYEINGTYINLFNPLEELPICRRAPYALCDKDGEDYGTRMFHVSGELKDGPYYIMESQTARTEMFSEDAVSLDNLKKYMLRSSRFFVDRPSIIQGLPFSEKRRYRDLLKQDIERTHKFNEYVESCKKAVQYSKKDN